MGAAFFISLERELPDVDIFMDGKMLCKAQRKLDRAARRLGVRPLADFVSVGADDVSDLLGEDAPMLDIPPAQWFGPEEGLRTVNALLDPANAVAGADAARDDLLAMQRILSEAQVHGVRWRLAPDV